jgi:hypothetical protein
MVLARNDESAVARAAAARASAGIVYGDSADQVAFFIETMSRHGTSILLALSLALRTALNKPGPHLGAFVLPPHFT